MTVISQLAEDINRVRRLGLCPEAIWLCRDLYEGALRECELGHPADFEIPVLAPGDVFKLVHVVVRPMGAQ